MSQALDHCGDLEKFLEGELIGEARARFNSHLAVCGTCREQVAAWQIIKEEYAGWVLDNSDVVTEVPDATEASLFAAAVLERLETATVASFSRNRSSAGSYFYVGAAAAVAVVLFGIFQLVVGRSDPQADAPVAKRLLPVTEKAFGRTFSVPVTEVANGAATKSVLEAGPGTFIEAPQTGRILASVLDDQVGLDASGVLIITAAEQHETDLRLVQGVAAFLVDERENGGRFRVQTGDVTVEVIGTRFSVSNSKDGLVSVSVAQGTVQVSDGDEKLTLTAGQSVKVERGIFSSVEKAGDREMNDMSRLLSAEIAATAGATDDAMARKAVDTDAAPTGNLLGTRRTQLIDSQNEQKYDEIWRKLILEGKAAEAYAQITAYLKASPDDTEKRMLLAACEKKLGLYQDAVNSYRRVSESDDAGTANRARYLGGEICQSKLGDYKEAAGFFDAYLKNAPAAAPNRAGAMLRLAESLLNTGDKARARNVLAQIISEYGRSPIANRARVLLAQNP